MDKLLLTVGEVAEVLGMSKGTCYELMRAGTLLSVKVGRSRRVPASALERFVAELQAQAEEAKRVDDERWAQAWQRRGVGLSA